MRKFTCFIFLLTYFLYPLLSQPCKEVIGYYPGWRWKDRNMLVKPSTIDYSKLTIINYAFMYPLEDGTISTNTPSENKCILLGDIDKSITPSDYLNSNVLGNKKYHLPNTSLVHYAHKNDVEVMISLGGWLLSNHFPIVAKDPDKRSNFAHWCNELVRTYNIDGIDVDWEYPGYKDHNGTPNDIYNFTLLMQEVRDSLDVLEETFSKKLKLTAAFGASPNVMDDIEWDKISLLLDYINLMSYDYHGAYSPKTNHNSPLYAPLKGDSISNSHSTVYRLINKYKVPSEKINLGIAFYGRSSKTKGTPGLHVPTTGSADIETFKDEGSPHYYQILEKIDAFDKNWDDYSKVPYLTGKGSLHTFVSYDDEKSIGFKAQYVVDNKLAGVIIWEITGDYIESSKGSGKIENPLSKKLNKVLCEEK